LENHLPYIGPAQSVMDPGLRAGVDNPAGVSIIPSGTAGGTLSKRGGLVRAGYPHQRIGHLLVSLVGLTCCTGCPVVSKLPAPGRVLTQREPEFGRKYYLYLPTRYDHDRRWPLVVTCHGTPWWDTARAQLDTWKGLAEKEGFLVAAPELIGTASVPRSAAEQIRRQSQDERAILSVVRSIRAARSVDQTRVFLTGWSAGAYAVLFTGLRNPDVFRALSVYQGNFDPAFVEPCAPFLDRYQPIQIVYGSEDPIANAQPCVDWLRSH
ncbi:unnamed protein product, partial [marine sediment metagenome]